MASKKKHPPLGEDAHRIKSSILSDSRQRQLLAILLERSQPLTERDLAVQLATRTRPRSDVTEDFLERLLVDLHHRCLPKLESVEWIERYPDGVVATEQLPFGRSNSSLPSPDDPDVRWEQLATVLARPHRKHVLSILLREDRPLSLEELAEALETHDRVPWTNEDRDDRRLLVHLHHADLPRLAEVGLVEYDPHEKTISLPSREERARIALL